MNLEKYISLVKENYHIEKDLYNEFNVKRGLRNSDGSGVLVGLTRIGSVQGYIKEEEEVVPVEGKLFYRGINVNTLVENVQKENRMGFEEVCFLLIFGKLPTRDELEQFNDLLDKHRSLPFGFTENMILKSPSNNVMNKLSRAILALYSHDEQAEDISLENIIRQSIELIASFPTMIAYGYQAKSHYFDNKSLFLHKPKDDFGTARNFLMLTRADKKFTPLEAQTLDIALMLHAEHGGGNNSAFTTHVVTSSDTDTYSAISAAVGSLKGPKHGGANIKVTEMMEDIKANVSNWESDNEVTDYLVKILNKEAYDKTGLIYGIGHAVYTLSDPRTDLLKKYALDLSKEKDREKEFILYDKVEKMAPRLFQEVKKTNKIVSANVDFYSGFVYDMLNIPPDLYTPIFAMSRISGWCAHRIEELICGGRIIRPAYKSVEPKKNYVPLSER